MNPSNSPVRYPADKRLPGLDHLRALAIIIVFFWHYRQSTSPGWVEAIGSFGWTGVDLFFVLSGYLIGGQLLQKIAQGGQPSLREFYIKRFFRILPAYLVVLFIYFLVPGFREREALPAPWKFLSFTQNFGLDISRYGTFSHAWSLCIEEQFYLVLPLIILCMTGIKAGKKSFYIAGFLFILGFAARIYSWNHFVSPLLQDEENNTAWIAWYKWIYYPSYNRLDGLLAGVCIAALFRFKPQTRDRITSYGNMLLLFGAALTAAAYFICTDMYSLKASIWGFPLVSVAYGVMMLAALSPNCMLFRFRFKVSETVATLAFCIYLTHKQVIHLTRAALENSGIDNKGNLMFCICIVTSLLAAWILHLVVEKPFLRLRTRVLSKGKLNNSITGQTIS